MVDASVEEYLQALRQINIALVKGLQTAITVVENPEMFTQEQRDFVIAKMKELIEGSQKAFGSEPTRAELTEVDKAT